MSASALQRWFIAVTMIRNPTLIFNRKGYLKNVILGMQNAIPISDQEVPSGNNEIQNGHCHRDEKSDLSLTQQVWELLQQRWQESSLLDKDIMLVFSILLRDSVSLHCTDFYIVFLMRIFKWTQTYIFLLDTGVTIYLWWKRITKIFRRADKYPSKLFTIKQKEISQED